MAFWLGKKPDIEPTPQEKQQESLKDFLSTFNWSVLWEEPEESGFIIKYAGIVSAVLCLIILLVVFFKK